MAGCDGGKLEHPDAESCVQMSLMGKADVSCRVADHSGYGAILPTVTPALSALIHLCSIANWYKTMV